METLTTVRKGVEFTVVNDNATRAWNFWEEHFPERWEPWVFELIDSKPADGSFFVDIGAWVGPFSMWAAHLGHDVIAVEPDPVAHTTLIHNTKMFERVEWLRLAVDDRMHARKLRTQGDYGNSMSTLLGDSDDGTLVDCAPLKHVFGPFPVGLVKIDTEGWEHVIMSGANLEDLHDCHCPIVVSLHLPWLTDEQKDRLWAGVNTFNVETLDDNGNGFPTLLLT